MVIGFVAATTQAMELGSQSNGDAGYNQGDCGVKTGGSIAVHLRSAASLPLQNTLHSIERLYTSTAAVVTAFSYHTDDPFRAQYTNMQSSSCE